MKRKSLWYFFPISIIVVVAMLILSTRVPFLKNIITSVKLTIEQFRSYIGWLGTAISMSLFIKTKFFDTGMFHKLRKSFGDQRFIIALEKMLLMLEVYDPETVVDKILSVSDVQIDMQKALIDLNKIMLCAVEKEDNYKISLSRRDKKKLKKEINKLLELIDVKLEMHYMQKDIKQEAEEAIETLQKTLIKSKLKKEIVDWHYKREDKKTKSKLLGYFAKNSDK